MILFYEILEPEKLTHSDGKQISASLGVGLKYGEAFWDDGNVSYFDWVMVMQVNEIYQNSSNSYT